MKNENLKLMDTPRMSCSEIWDYIKNKYPTDYDLHEAIHNNKNLYIDYQNIMSTNTDTDEKPISIKIADFEISHGFKRYRINVEKAIKYGILVERFKPEHGMIFTVLDMDDIYYRLIRISSKEDKWGIEKISPENKDVDSWGIDEYTGYCVMLYFEKGTWKLVDKKIKLE